MNSNSPEGTWVGGVRDIARTAEQLCLRYLGTKFRFLVDRIAKRYSHIARQAAFLLIPKYEIPALRDRHAVRANLNEDDDAEGSQVLHVSARLPHK